MIYLPRNTLNETVLILNKRNHIEKFTILPISDGTRTRYSPRRSNFCLYVFRDSTWESISPVSRFLCYLELVGRTEYEPDSFAGNWWTRRRRQVREDYVKTKYGGNRMQKLKLFGLAFVRIFWGNACEVSRNTTSTHVHVSRNIRRYSSIESFIWKFTTWLKLIFCAAKLIFFESEFSKRKIDKLIIY